MIKRSTNWKPGQATAKLTRIDFKTIRIKIAWTCIDSRISGEISSDLSEFPEIGKKTGKLEQTGKIQKFQLWKSNVIGVIFKVGKRIGISHVEASN